jgi:hypothetical protein
MSKCFYTFVKNNWLQYKTCDRCRCTDDKYGDTHKEQIKVYRDQYYLDNQDKIKEYREVNKDKIKKKQKNIVKQIRVNAKNSERMTCECGCTSRRDKISQHKKSSCQQKLIEEKKKLQRNLTDEE